MFVDNDCSTMENQVPSFSNDMDEVDLFSGDLNLSNPLTP